MLTAFISRVSAWLAVRSGPRVPIVTGLLVMSTGLPVLGLGPAALPVWALVAPVVPVGGGGAGARPAPAPARPRGPVERAGR
ncbi:MFS transporter, partial [Streptomyces sp. NPDC048279]